VLVVGQREGEALEFCLSRSTDPPGPVAVLSTDLPAPDIAGLRSPDVNRPPLHVVDCTGGVADAEDLDVPSDTSVTVSDRGLPAVGEAAVEALAEEPPPRVTRLCLDSISTLVSLASVQEVYKLLYVLARQVRARRAVAFYTWDGSVENKTTRILGRALDYRVTLDTPDGPTVRSLPGRSSGDG
jgi:hypothetical protein